ncbi:hypothetical protein CRG98_048078 [Punica granatum]|uniref:Uncharacterized protein n=1 Tax=Punica granatum TaxID=22663 RepID=A0A2I0HIJ6_PUNGR|nr:hypothetical protein CRG98_048078 [Punica granatum]
MEMRGRATMHDVKIFINLVGIEATDGLVNPNREVMAGVVALPAGIGRILNLRVLLILGGGGLDSGHHPPIGISSVLLPIGLSVPSVASILSKLTENLISC